MAAFHKKSPVPDFRGTIWPDSRQELLLKSALLPPQEAVLSWKEWRRLAAFEEIDPASARLLPLVWRNLGDLLPEPDKNICKGAYKKSWYQNQHLLRDGAELLRLFGDNGIDSIVLKGGALIVLYYKNFGARPMGDFDILVPYNRAEEAGRLLEFRGWKPSFPRTLREHMHFKHSGEYAGEKGSKIDLHWYLNDASRGMWDPFAHPGRLIPVKIGAWESRTLDAEAFLLHNCTHGLAWSLMPSFRWIADAFMILRSTQKSFDWNRFCEDAKTQKLLLPAWEGISYLRTLSPSEVPENVVLKLQELVRKEVSAAEFKMHEGGKKAPPKWGAVHDLWKDHVLSLWSLSKDKNKPVSLARKLATLPEFLKNYWSLRSQWQIPGVLLRKILRRPANLLPWSVPFDDKKSGKSSPHDRPQQEENRPA